MGDGGVHGGARPRMLLVKGCVGWLNQAGVEEPVPVILAIMRRAVVATHARRGE